MPAPNGDSLSESEAQSIERPRSSVADSNPILPLSNWRFISNKISTALKYAFLALLIPDALVLFSQSIHKPK
jgi:hypothetical protein